MSNYNFFFDYIKTPINTIFEIGCRDLNDSITLSNYFNSKVYSYEANPIMKEICLKKCEKYEKIRFFSYGLGDKKSYEDFHIYTPNKQNDIVTIGASSFFKRTDYNNNQTTYCEKIKITTLYDEVEQLKIDKIDLLCMDVQGYELKILQGSYDFLKNIKYIILEITKEKNCLCN
jgi:FkbM family methyltransferase